MSTQLKEKINISVDTIQNLSEVDLADLCNITEQAIKAGGGFGWVSIPPRADLIKYWNGITLIDHKTLIVGRLNGDIAGTLQLSFQPPNNEAQKNITKDFWCSEEAEWEEHERDNRNRIKVRQHFQFCFQPDIG